MTSDHLRVAVHHLLAASAHNTETSILAAALALRYAGLPVTGVQCSKKLQITIQSPYASSLIEAPSPGAVAVLTQGPQGQQEQTYLDAESLLVCLLEILSDQKTCPTRTR